MSALVLCLLTLTFLPIFAEDIENPDVDRPVVSFTPDWRMMFYNETLTISCLHPYNVKYNDTYTWYRNDIQMDVKGQNFTISSIQLYDRAVYQCQIRTSLKSEPVRPHVITDLTILRVSRYIFEGDILTLKCDSRLDVNTTNAQVSFSRNFELVKPMNYETHLFVGKVDRTVTGRYKCTKKAIFKNEIKESAADEMIEVTELFSPPEIKISQHPISVGMVMNLTCMTTLNPFRADTELEFAFYKDGWHVREFGSSNKYTVQFVQLDDSGYYTCEVRTIMNSVRKMSKELSVLIQESIKPVLSAYPNWNKVFRFEHITLTCRDQTSTKFSWYKDKVKLRSTERTLNILSTGDTDIGHYQCQGESGDWSNTIHLDVFFVWLILQVPLSIHEGDSVTLKCKMWRTGSAVNTTFYKDDKMIQFLGSQSDLILGTVSKNATGKYKCTRFINTGSISKIYDAEEYISVTELFSSPEIRLNLHPVVEGADMTLTCHTTVSQMRQSTRLAFAFYKNGNILQEFSESNKYKLSSAQLEDSGSYACEAKSSTNIMKKRSETLSINVQGMAVVSFAPNFGKILTAETMTMTCNVDAKIKDKQAYVWYKDSNQMNITQQTFTIENALVSDSGYYQCQSTNTHMSEPLRLDVSNSNLIVQAPPFTLEGDELTITCHHRQGLDLERTTFYKNGALFKILGIESVMTLGNAYYNMTGEYKCTKNTRLSSFSYGSYSAYLYVPISEFFTYLVLKAKTTSIIEGDPISLSCDVSLNPTLNPLRGSTKLQFAFYKDEKKIQDYGEVHTYQIAFAIKKNSGNYTCSVRCTSNNVVKVSQKLDLDVQELFSTPVVLVKPTNVQLGELMSVTCDYAVHPKRSISSVTINMYKNAKVLRKRYVTTYFADDSDSGEYMCELADSSRSIVRYSNTSYILVEEKVVGAKIRADPEDPKMLVGSNVTITCSVSKGSSLSFTWLHNMKHIDLSSESYQVRQDGRVLFIGSLQKYNSGLYQCKVSNHFSSTESNELKVSVIDPIGSAFLSTDKKVLDFTFQDSFTFTCSLAQGNGSHFFWIHNEQHLKKDTSIYEFREGGKVLHIKSAQAHHEGSYQCRAEKDISSRQTLVSKSNTLTLKMSSKCGSYVKPLLIILVLASLVLISIVVYKYQNKIAKPQFLQRKPHITRMSVEKVEDKVLLMENMENIERNSISLH
ncbi:Fc receptor-like protein 5 isoform X2 [Dendrobates tinctorius]|uniref:Fc receptor-like protein 5 isoform X2 n=1 Tax=Dendrobates tinctorius TaxID=92724 RepID=UPI003CC9BE8D